MAKSYLPTERDQPFLLPPDMREWLPEKHLVWLVLEVVREMDTTELHARHRNDGPGRKAYDPDMLLGLLVYAYCRGIRSSREIEGLCEVDVAFRVLSANHFPDHSTISRFRQSSVGVMERLFCQVLELCWRAGMVSVGGGGGGRDQDRGGGADGGQSLPSRFRGPGQKDLGGGRRGRPERGRALWREPG